MVMRNRQDNGGSPSGWWDDLPPRVKARFAGPLVVAQMTGGPATDEHEAAAARRLGATPPPRGAWVTADAMFTARPGGRAHVRRAGGGPGLRVERERRSKGATPVEVL